MSQQVHRVIQKANRVRGLLYCTAVLKLKTDATKSLFRLCINPTMTDTLINKTQSNTVWPIYFTFNELIISTFVEAFLTNTPTKKGMQ